MIPKLIHLLWVNRGGCPVPPKCEKFTQRWKELHPDYDVKVWGLEEVRQLQDDTFEKLWADADIDEASVCNLMRMVIVHKFGGIYADIDTEPLKSFDPLMECPNLGVGAHGKNGKFELNLFFAGAGSLALAAGIKFYKESSSGLYGFEGRLPPIMDAMANACPEGITKYPEAYFQGCIRTAEAYSTHWIHALRSWPHLAIKRRMSLRGLRRKQPLAVDPRASVAHLQEIIR